MKNVQKSCLVRTKGKICLLTRFETIQIIDQRKAFCRQRIPGSSCVRKETIDIDALIASRNVGRKIGQPIRIISGPATTIRKGDQFSKHSPQKQVPPRINSYSITTKFHINPHTISHLPPVSSSSLRIVITFVISQLF